MANDVKLTFTGDATSLEKSFDQVGSSARRMEHDTKAAADGFDRIGEAADTTDTRAMGFRDTLTGVQDGLAGVKSLSNGISFEGLLLLGTSVGDLGSAMFNFLIPSLKSTVTWLRAGGLQAKAMAVWNGILSGGTKLWAGAQWLLNSAFLASPITWIVIGIIALVAVVVLIATKTTWFQTIWKKAWEGIQLYIRVFKAVWSGVWQGIVAAFGFLRSAVATYASFWVSMWSRVIGFVRGVPGKIRSFFSGLGAWFRSVGSNIINGIIGGIRAKVGQLASVAANAAKSALNAAKKFLHIASPSRVFRDEVGKMMVLGMAEGVTGNMSAVHGALEQVPTDLGPGRETMNTLQAADSRSGHRPVTVQVVVGGNTDADRAMGAWMQKIARNGHLKALAI